MDIIICDDVTDDRKLICSYCQRFMAEMNFNCKIKEFESAEDMLKNYLSSQDWSIIFLDIYMAGQTGIEAGEKLRAMGYNNVIILSTSCNSMATQSYNIGSCGYLLKPYDYAQFCTTMNRAVAQLSDSFKSITVISNRLQRKVFLKDIYFAEIAGHSLIIHTATEKLATKITMNELEKLLCYEDNFLRCHRSYIVNLNFVGDFSGDDILMLNGEKALITIRDRAKFKQQIANYCVNKIELV